MEQYAAPNAGLFDQRLVFQFVQDHIAKFGGDKNNVSAWGKSAGAGSIMHHLVARDGPHLRKPLFRKAVLQSGAYQWQWDRLVNGITDKAFQSFTKLTGCPSTGKDAIKCLQYNKTDAELAGYNQQLYNDTKCSGVHTIGPAVDGKTITHLPTISLAKGDFSPLDSMIVSHVWDDSKLFIPKYITNDTDLCTFLKYFLPGDAYVTHRASILSQPPYNVGKPVDRAQLLIQDSMFTCNTRFVYDAFSKNTTVYMLNYGYLHAWPWHAALHASDLLPTFWNYDTDIDAIVKLLKKLANVTVPRWLVKTYMPPFALRFRHYLVSHAISGNPNQPPYAKSPFWAPDKQPDDKLTGFMQTQYKLNPKPGEDFLANFKRRHE